MTDLNLEPPSGKKIAIATLGAAVLAILVLVTTVLPAEYGVDPTGLGEALGLTAMSQPVRTFEIADVTGGNEGVFFEVEIPDFGDPIPLPNPEIHQDEAGPPRTETVVLTIAPDGETEIKTALKEAKMIMYSWAVDQGTIYSDFHGHDPERSTEYWVRYREHQEGSGGNGSLVAPFNGEHGWYWVNYNLFPVTVTLTVTGYYDEIIDYSELF